jgi:hypothetical protein
MKRFLPKRFSNFLQESEETQPTVAMWGGVIFGLIGLFFVLSTLLFFLSSVEAEIRVVAIESKIDDEDGTITYRAFFEANGEEGRTVRYASDIWSSIMPHVEGEIVAGNVNRETGEIRSIAIMKRDVSFGLLLLGVAAFAFYQGRKALRETKWLPWNWQK